MNDESRRAAGRRIIESMPATIDRIKAERERASARLRKAMRKKDRWA